MTVPDSTPVRRRTAALALMPLALATCQPSCVPTPGPVATTTTTAAPTTTTLAPRPVGQLYTHRDGTPWTADGNPWHWQALEWADTRPADAATMAAVAEQPMAMWVETQGVDGQPAAVERQVDARLDAAAGHLPVLVLYNIPDRDLGSHSAGGTSDHAAYRAWVDAVARGIAGRPAIVIVEPDALSQTPQLPVMLQGNRLDSLSYAIAALRTDDVHVYLDAAAPWPLIDVPGIAELVDQLTARPTGLAVNVSHYFPTSAAVAYGQHLSTLTGGLHVVVDTSRNGAPAPDDAWCNPPGRALGPAPTLDTGRPLVDAYLWIKTPGRSDGPCAPGDPIAGAWWPERALELARLAGY